ncbi:MAG: fibronectin type III domain-containing protein [Deltaproteobacteria bacterium]|nr:fibronectin type III domain-containing protein [Deltaproteobacteria bacterium]
MTQTRRPAPWRLLACAASLFIAAACEGSGDIEDPVSDGDMSHSLTNPIGHLVATAETVSLGARQSGTYLQTQALDGARERLRESRGTSTYGLKATWSIPLGGASGNLALKVVARRASATGDEFNFGWAVSSGGPFSQFCALTSADTAYKTCRHIVTIPPGTATLFIRVADSMREIDTSTNAIEVDYLAAIPFDCSVCSPVECQAASICNANETGCTVTPAADGAACTRGSCQAGTCVATVDPCAGVTCAAGESCNSATGACECTATSCPAGYGCGAEQHCVQSSETVVLVGDTTIEPTEDYEYVGDADAFEYTSGAQAGKASKINVYAAASNQATALQVALYGDNAGVPGAMLAGSSCTISMPAGAAGWFGCALNDGPALTPNVKYWMAALSTGGEFHWQAQDGTHGRYSYSADQSSLPATWTQTGTYAGYSRSAYVEGIATGTPFDCSTCVPAECQTSVCNAARTGCTSSPAPEGTACASGTCQAGICVPVVDPCAGVACAAGESCSPATGACECTARSCPAGFSCGAEKRCVQSSVTMVLVGDTSIEPVEDYETVGDADAFEYTSGAQAGKASNINIYAAAGNQATALQVALYADNGGVPGALLAGSSCTISLPAGVAGWFGCALSNGPVLSPNTRYWMAALSTSGEFHWRAQDGSHGRYSYSTHRTSLPAIWTQTGTYAGYSRSAYVEGAVTNPTLGTAVLSWEAPTTFTDGSPLTDLTGYRIHYGTSSGSYPSVVNVSNPTAVTYTVSNLPGGATYYFVVTALSASGGESARSMEASKTIP